MQAFAGTREMAGLSTRPIAESASSRSLLLSESFRTIGGVRQRARRIKVGREHGECGCNAAIWNHRSPQVQNRVGPSAYLDLPHRVRQVGITPKIGRLWPRALRDLLADGPWRRYY